MEFASFHSHGFYTVFRGVLDAVLCLFLAALICRSILNPAQQNHDKIPEVQDLGRWQALAALSHFETYGQVLDCWSKSGIRFAQQVHGGVPEISDSGKQAREELAHAMFISFGLTQVEDSRQNPDCWSISCGSSSRDQMRVRISLAQVPLIIPQRWLVPSKGGGSDPAHANFDHDALILDLFCSKQEKKFATILANLPGCDMLNLLHALLIEILQILISNRTPGKMCSNFLGKGSKTSMVKLKITIIYISALPGIHSREQQRSLFWDPEVFGGERVVTSLIIDGATNLPLSHCPSRSEKDSRYKNPYFVSPRSRDQKGVKIVLFPVKFHESWLDLVEEKSSRPAINHCCSDYCIKQETKLVWQKPKTSDDLLICMSSQATWHISQIRQFTTSSQDQGDTWLLPDASSTDSNLVHVLIKAIAQIQEKHKDIIEFTSHLPYNAFGGLFPAIIGLFFKMGSLCFMGLILRLIMVNNECIDRDHVKDTPNYDFHAVLVLDALTLLCLLMILGMIREKGYPEVYPEDQQEHRPIQAGAGSLAKPSILMAANNSIPQTEVLCSSRSLI